MALRRPSRGAGLRAGLAVCVLAAGLLSSCGDDGVRGTATEASSPGPASTSPAAAAPASTGAAAAPTAGTAQARVAAALAGMDRRHQVSQLFVVGVKLANLSAGDTLVRQGVGGVFLSGRSTAAATALGATTARWAGAAPGPRPWVAVDQEGGLVQTLSGPGFAKLPTALAQGALPAGQLAALADGMGGSLHTAGVTVDLAPVADVVPPGTEKANPPIGAFSRQYGGTAAAVTPAAGAVVGGLAQHRVTATLKHFPGLGRVQANTDTSPTVVDTTTTAGDDQVAAFGTLARSASPFVMMSSATYTKLDPSSPAAFSSAVVTDLLRHRLGFSGVVISDDLGSAKVVQAVPAGERAVRFVAAGGTLVLTVTPTLLPAMIDAVVARAAADPVFSAQVDAAVRTSLAAKERAGLLGS